MAHVLHAAQVYQFYQKLLIFQFIIMRDKVRNYEMNNGQVQVVAFPVFFSTDIDHHLGT